MKTNKVKSLIDAARFYRATLGFRGLVALCLNYCAGWMGEISVTPPGMKHAVHLRVRTSDVLLYSFILCRLITGNEKDYTTG